MKKQVLWAVAPILAFSISACGKKRGSLDINFVSTASLNVVGFNNAIENLDFSPLSYTSTFLDVGTDSGLISYKVYFREIKLCESLTTSGTGYSSPSGCAELYKNDSDAYTGQSAPTADDVTRFTAAGTGKYYDLLSATDLAALKAAMATSIEARNYSWGIIETHPWIKITAKSGTYCTKSGGTLVGTDQYDSSIQVASLACGSSAPEEALIYIVNGNSSFKFNTPLQVAEGASVRADVVFNLDDNVRLTQGFSGALATVGLTDTAQTTAFSAPMFAASPVVLAAGANIVKESYEFALSAESDASIAGSTYLVDLYYSSTDTTKTPFAVTGGLINPNESGTRTGGFGRSEKFDEIVVDGSTIKLADWQGLYPITFTRTDAGTSSAGSLTCGPSSATTGYLGGCPSGATAAVTATLTDANGPTVSTIE